MEPTTLSSTQEAAFISPTQILVATDLTDGDYLVPHVIAQAKASHARVTLIHAILPTDTFPLEAGYVPYLDETVMEREVRVVLTDIARKIEREGIFCDVSFKHGFPADVVRETINNTGATRLIMGSHGRGKLGQLALGSVANQLLGSVAIPVFVVGPHALAAADNVVPKRILHPVSLAGDYRKSADLALTLAQSYGAELTFLHVLDRDVEQTVNRERTLTWAKNALMALVPKSGGLALPVNARAIYGRLVEEILSAATQTGADWIVLGVNKEVSSLPFRDSNAYKVIVAAKCGVLTIHHNPQGTEEENFREMHLAGAIGVADSRS
jgi:nucleotide-binding universal stress UspA family protein